MFWKHAEVTNPQTYSDLGVVTFSNNNGKNPSYTDAYLITLRHPTWHTMASINIFSVPFCCGMLFIGDLVSYSRDKGHAKQLLRVVERFAKVGGYKAVQCVVANTDKQTKTNNVRRLNLFKTMGYKYLIGSKFVNPRTDNVCRTLQLTLE